jgi:hypothetical protein
MPNASLDQTCDGVIFDAVIAKDRSAFFDQVAATAILTASVELGRVARYVSATAEAQLTATVTLGEPTPPEELLETLPARLYNLTGRVRSSGGCVVVFKGPANRTVAWSLASGYGTLTAYTTRTNAVGQAIARYDAGGIPGRVVIRATFVR